MMPENRPSSPILAFALEAMIASRIQKALNFQESILFSPILPSKFGKITPNPSEDDKQKDSKADIYRQIKPKRIQSSSSLQYASAAALQLTRSALDAGCFAVGLKHSLFQSIQSIPASYPEAQIWQHCLVSVDLRGWLHIEISDPGIAIWLETLRSSTTGCDLNPMVHADNQKDMARNIALEKPSQASRSQGPSAAISASAELFKVLYVHARCCSLLDRSFSGSESASPHWLTGLELRCSQPTERRLIAALCDGLDFLSAFSFQPGAALKTALRLSQAFEVFEADCRLCWPESAATGLEADLLAVRLGLIGIVQQLLQILLEQRLFVPAPTQL